MGAGQEGRRGQDACSLIRSTGTTASQCSLCAILAGGAQPPYQDPHPNLTSHPRSGFGSVSETQDGGELGSDESWVPSGGPAPAHMPRAEHFRRHSQFDQPFGAPLSQASVAGRPLMRTACGPHAGLPSPPSGRSASYLGTQGMLTSEHLALLVLCTWGSRGWVPSLLSGRALGVSQRPVLRLQTEPFGACQVETMAFIVGDEVTSHHVAIWGSASHRGIRGCSAGGSGVTDPDFHRAAGLCCCSVGPGGIFWNSGCLPTLLG